MEVPQTKKKLQHRKAPGAPKRFKSSYIFFVQERHKQIQEAAAQRRRQSTGSQLVEESSMEEGKRVSQVLETLHDESTGLTMSTLNDTFIAALKILDTNSSVFSKR